MTNKCKICGGLILLNETHIHRENCVICGRRPLWCRCEGRNLRGEGISRAFTKEGIEIFLHSIITIAPVARAIAARQMSANFLQSIGCNAVVGDMLPTQLRPIGGGDVSHIMCERFAYTDEVLKQVDWIRDSGFLWAANRLHDITDNANLMKAMMVTIKSPKDGGVLNYLGLEEIP